MAESTISLTRGKFDFLTMSLGKRVVVQTQTSQPTLQPERYAGILEAAYDDSLLIRPDSGRLVLIYKHAIVCVSETEASGTSPSR
jgi:hypothetical protein